MTTKLAVDIDPMAILKEKKRKKNRKKKMKLTKKAESFCKDCERTRSIENFGIYKSKDGYIPLKRCIECDSKKYKRGGENKPRYKDDEKLREMTKESGKKASRIISDSYIKRLYCKKGYKFKDVTPEMIVKKRTEIIERRYNAKYNGWKSRGKDTEYRNKYRNNLVDSYIRVVIKRSSLYKGEEITDKMIEEKREMILFERKIKERKEEEKKNRKPYIFNVPRDIKNQIEF